MDNITTLLSDYDLILLNEAANNNTLKVELLDIEKFIKVNRHWKRTGAYKRFDALEDARQYALKDLKRIA